MLNFWRELFRSQEARTFFFATFFSIQLKFNAQFSSESHVGVSRFSNLPSIEKSRSVFGRFNAALEICYESKLATNRHDLTARNQCE